MSYDTMSAGGWTPNFLRSKPPRIYPKKSPSNKQAWNKPYLTVHNHCNVPSRPTQFLVPNNFSLHECGGRKILRNFGIGLRSYTVPIPRRPSCEQRQRQKPENLPKPYNYSLYTYTFTTETLKIQLS
jgi:hypothetical protein